MLGAKAYYIIAKAYYITAKAYYITTKAYYIITKAPYLIGQSEVINIISMHNTSIKLKKKKVVSIKLHISKVLN